MRERRMLCHREKKAEEKVLLLPRERKSRTPKIESVCFSLRAKKRSDGPFRGVLIRKGANVKRKNDRVPALVGSKKEEKARKSFSGKREQKLTSVKGTGRKPQQGKRKKRS